MSPESTGFPRGRVGWIFGSILILAIGVVVGMLLNNIVFGLVIAVVVSLGWIIAYESWRGRQVGIYNRDDDGAQL